MKGLGTMDRFESGSPDPQDEKAELLCSVANCEIYRGDDFYRIDGVAVCEDCLPLWAAEYKEKAGAA